MTLFLRCVIKMYSNVEAAGIELNGRAGYETEFVERVRVNQKKLTAEIRPYYDFIVCGSGSFASCMTSSARHTHDERSKL